MKKIICMLLFIQSGFMMAQTETVVTPNGKKVTFYPGAPGTADNGLTITSGNIQLGGALTKPSILTTTSAYTLAILGLQTGTSTDDIVVADANGVLRKIAPSNLITKYDLSSTTPNTVLEVNGLGATLAAASVNIKPSANVGEVLTTTATGVVGWKKPAVDAGDITTKANLTTNTPSTVLQVSGTGATLAAASVDIKPSATVGEVMTTTATGVVGWKKPAVDAGDITTKANLTTNTPSTVLQVSGTGATLAAASVDIKPSVNVGEVLTTTAAGVVGWKAAVAPNVMEIKIINSNYTVTATDYTIIARNLGSDITITLPDATANKGRLLVINQFNTLLADGKTPVTVKFNTNVIYSDSVSVAYIAGSIFEGATAGSAKVTLQSDGTSWYVITYNM
ncbi:hypothetical protein [Flavobacterium humidisoli]|uniref:Uncharacterized protein n=1 Tax=Flavobacterium humidisoli TaxID=2937442 RepID=A0ABY4LQ19_9FLAO|nr:hypothetical protein [Flavobacterium humidisoli]UPZ15150.1 hypothetical protein M0M44_20630 [Flavobacterium humidisoli]